jgi:hypothetical protein
MWFVFVTVLLRAIVPPGFMLDSHAPAGAYGLVMCDGHGPMYMQEDAGSGALTDVAGDDAEDAGHAVTDGIASSRRSSTGMQSMAGAMSIDGTMSGITADVAGHTDGSTASVCPFSAVLVHAVLNFAVVLFLCFVVVRAKPWLRPTHFRSRPSCVLHEARAPPAAG